MRARSLCSRWSLSSAGCGDGKQRRPADMTPPPDMARGPDRSSAAVAPHAPTTAPVQTAPEVWTVVWQGDEAFGADVVDFVDWMLHSDYWKTSLGEYGIGAGKSKGLIVLPTAAPALHRRLRSSPASRRCWSSSGQITGNDNTQVAFFPPSTTKVNRPAASAAARPSLGYHAHGIELGRRASPTRSPRAATASRASRSTASPTRSATRSPRRRPIRCRADGLRRRRARASRRSPTSASSGSTCRSTCRPTRRIRRRGAIGCSGSTRISAPRDGNDRSVPAAAVGSPVLERGDRSGRSSRRRRLGGTDRRAARRLRLRRRRRYPVARRRRPTPTSSPPQGERARGRHHPHHHHAVRRLARDPSSRSTSSRSRRRPGRSCGFATSAFSEDMRPS